LNPNPKKTLHIEAVQHLRVIDPIPYRVLNSSTAFGPNAMVASVNFAFGGSGVFPTFGANFPNISAQIGQFQELLRKHIVPAALIESSVVLLVIAGNDYTVYSNQHPSNQVSLLIPPSMFFAFGSSLLLDR
jgi:hypothetical protein